MAGPITFKPLEGRARKAILALAVAVLVDAAVGVHSLVDAAMLSREIAAPGTVSEDRLELSDKLTGLGGTLQLAALGLAAVFFLRWFHRATENLTPLGGGERYSPTWAVGSWFVPFVSLVVPKRASNDLWRAGDPDDFYPAVIDLWWAAWVMSSLLGNAVGRMTFGAEDLADFRTADYVDVATSAASVVAGVLAILVVREITRRQAERRREGALGVHHPLSAATHGPAGEVGWRPVASD